MLYVYYVFVSRRVGSAELCRTSRRRSGRRRQYGATRHDVVYCDVADTGAYAQRDLRRFRKNRFRTIPF